MADGEQAFERAVERLRRAATFGIRPSLDGIRALTEALARPQDSFRVVQVTGTNGKTSVTRALSELLAAEGLESAAYTSPHLWSYRERIVVGGLPCGEDEFAAAVEAAVAAAEASGRGEHSFTEFELLTAAALWLFRERSVAVACLEVGMGGRWDATSVTEPEVAVITGVSLDHTERLGSTTEAIAFDKSHVIKPGSRVVLGPGTSSVSDVFLRRAEDLGCPVRYVVESGDPSPVPEERTVTFRVLSPPSEPGGILGLEVRGAGAAYAPLEVRAPSYQAANLAVAVAAAESMLGRALRLEPLRETLGRLRFPGRFELVADDPPLVLDGAHNPAAASVLAGAIAEAWHDAAVRPVCLIGVLADKDAVGIVRALAPVVSDFVVTQPESERALDARELGSVVSGSGARLLGIEPDPIAALALARQAQAGRGIVVTGSLYLVGALRQHTIGGDAR